MLVYERWRNAELLDKDVGSDTTGAIIEMQQQLGEDLKNQSYATTYVSARFLPLMRTIAESGVYVLTPLVLALAFTPAMGGTIKSASMAYVWLLLWAPLYVVVNYVLYTDGQSQVQLVLPPSSRALTLANYSDIMDVLGALNSFASSIVWSVPSVAAVLTYSLNSAVSAMMGGASGAQAATAHESAAYAHGEGKHVQSGQQLMWQEGITIDSQGYENRDPHASFGSAGLSVHHQDGRQEIRFSDGGQLLTGRDGTQTYTGPNGHWSRDAEGHLIGGVYRHEAYDERSGQAVMMQTSVAGSEVERKFSYKGEHGVERHVEESHDQFTNAMIRRDERSLNNGVTEERHIAQDMSQEIRQHGNRQLKAVYGNKEIDGAFDLQWSGNRPAPTTDDPLPQDKFGAGTIHSTDGSNKTLHGVPVVDEHGQVSHFQISEGEDISGLRYREVKGGLQHEGQMGQDNTGFEISHGAPGPVRIKGGHDEERLVYGDLTQMSNVDRTDPNHPIKTAAYGILRTNANGKDEIFQGTMKHDENGAYLDVAASHSEKGDWSRETGREMQVGDYTLHSGGVFEHQGDWSDPHAQMKFTGPISDKHGHHFIGDVSMKDGVLTIGSLGSGVKEQQIATDGTRTTLFGDPQSATRNYEKVWSEDVWLAQRDKDGHVRYEPIGNASIRQAGVAHQYGNGTSLEPSETHLTRGTGKGQDDLRGDLVSVPMSTVMPGSTGLVAEGADGAPMGSVTGSFDHGVGSDQEAIVFYPGSGKRESNHIQETRVEVAQDGHTLESKRLDTDADGHVVSGHKSSIVRHERLTEMRSLGGGFPQEGAGEFLETPDGKILSGHESNNIRSNVVTGRWEDGKVLGSHVEGNRAANSTFHVDKATEVSERTTQKGNAVAHEQSSTAFAGDAEGHVLNERQEQGFRRDTWDVGYSAVVKREPDPFNPGYEMQVYAHSISNPRTGEVVSQDIKKDTFGKAMAERMVDGKLQKGELTWAADGKGGMVYKWDALSQEKADVGGFAMQSEINGEGRVINKDGRKGTDLQERERIQIKHDSQMDFTLVGDHLIANGADLTHLSETDRNLLGAAAAWNNAVDAVNKLGSIARPAGRRMEKGREQVQERTRQQTHEMKKDQQRVRDPNRPKDPEGQAFYDSLKKSVEKFAEDNDIPINGSSRSGGKGKK
jgi:hypothetical protein